MSEVERYLQAKANPQTFISSYCQLQNPSSLRAEPFALWEYQGDILDWWRENRLTIILKARQLGISWLAAAFALWLAIFYNDVVVLFISQNEKKAWGLIS